MLELQMCDTDVSLNLQLQKSAAFVRDVFTIPGSGGARYYSGRPGCGPVPAV